MNNEPVAWMDKNEVPSTVKSDLYNIPLYTKPQIKELSDEEIDDFTVRIYNCRTGAEAHEIVLAILKKASEQ